MRWSLFSVLGLSASLIIFYQNCGSQEVDFAPYPVGHGERFSSNEGTAGSPVSGDGPDGSIADSGDFGSGGDKIFIPDQGRGPGVVTLLMAMGDRDLGGEQINSIRPEQVIFLEALDFVSPVAQPRILVIRDRNAGSESFPTTEYIARKLLSAFEVDLIEEPQEGMGLQDFQGYDVVVLSNPGYSMGSKATSEALQLFSGGVILAGDDLSQGSGFEPQELTGLRYKSNGTSISCDGKYYQFDNNKGHQYVISVESQSIDLRYGNDIDFTEVMRPDLQVFATATYMAGDCLGEIPVIVGYKK